MPKPPTLNLTSIETAMLDNSMKGYPYAAPPCAVADIGGQGWNVLRGDLPFPIALLKESALEHNLAWMADFARASGVLLAPHGKTTMAPQLFERQLAAGAWGMTLATMQQVTLCVGYGLRKIVLANQLAAEADIAQAARLLRDTLDLEFYFLIDSLAQLELLCQGAARHGLVRPFTALIEIGVLGGRTGCRSVEQALELARAVAASTHVRLGGIECYEGQQVTGDSDADSRAVDALMRTVHDVARRCDAESLFGCADIVLSAGGSAAFDVVARVLPTALSRPVRTILRSGCYLTLDSGFYARFLRQVIARSGAEWRERPGLRPALEVWTQVQSQPEPGLAILAMGKRDASFDIDLPIPFAQLRGTQRTTLDASWRIVKLNDQHAYLHMPPAADLRVGDLIGSGISHPCTTFDKWRWLPVVDDDYNVRAAVKTFF